MYKTTRGNNSMDSPAYKPITVAIVNYEHALASAIIGIMDILSIVA